MSFIREQVVKRFSRSSGWGKVRAEHIKKHPRCASCGSKSRPEVHHIKDFSTHPKLELQKNNLITLCGSTCHLLIGHLKYWRSINPNVRDDAKEMLKKVKARRKN